MKKTMILICSLFLLCLLIYGCASKEERTYQKLIILLEQNKFEEADKLIANEYLDNDVDLKHYKQYQFLSSYMIAKDYAAKEHYASAYDVMENVPYSYDGPVRDKIIEFKKTLLLDVADMTPQEMVEQINADDKEIADRVNEEIAKLKEAKD